MVIKREAKAEGSLEGGGPGLTHEGASPSTYCHLQLENLAFPHVEALQQRINTDKKREKKRSSSVPRQFERQP